MFVCLSQLTVDLLLLQYVCNIQIAGCKMPVQSYNSQNMNPISLISNHNPKNQLNFFPAQTSQMPQIPTNNQIKPSEVKIQQTHDDRDSRFYEQEIKKLTYINTIITAQLASALQQRKIVMKLISEAQQREFSHEKIEQEKRARRCAKDIQRKFNCPWKGCEKSYGTEGSLLQHIRLKHPKVNSHDPPLLLDPA